VSKKFKKLKKEKERKRKVKIDTRDNNFIHIEP